MAVVLQAGVILRNHVQETYYRLGAFMDPGKHAAWDNRAHGHDNRSEWRTHKLTEL